MEEDDDDHQESLGGEAQLVSVGDVLLIRPSKLVRQESPAGGALRVRVGAKVAVDEGDEGVGEVLEALQDVADTLRASQATQPGDQGIPPVNASLTDHIHLGLVVKTNPLLLETFPC